VGLAARRASVPPLLFSGFAVACIGGPLALAALYVPGAAGEAAALTTLAGAFVFAVPVAIWLRYSERVVSAGGLAAFVEAAAGRRAALVQGWIWTISYFLYLPYTVTYVVYDVLAKVFPGLAPWRPALELVLPLAIVALVLLPLAALLAGVLAVSAVQLLLVLALGAAALTHAGVAATAFTSPGGFDPAARATAGVGLLFVCASLPLFLGAEARGGARTVRASLAAAYVLVATYVFFAALPLAGVPAHLRTAELPGVEIAQAYSGRALAVAVGVAAAASVTALIVAEYLALSRLLHYLHGVPIRRALAAIAVPFVAADALSLIDPDRFYDDLLQPSLAALFLSQLVVVALYPLFRRRVSERVGPATLAASLVASALMGWGFYVAVTSGGST
jgi:hypothetical protein